MTNEQKQVLERQLWNIANELRGRKDADEFRDYILGFVFALTVESNRSGVRRSSIRGARPAVSSNSDLTT